MANVVAPIRPGADGTATGGGDSYDGDVEHRLTALETRLDTILPTLATKGDVEKASGELVKWVVGTAFAGVAVFITVMTFVLNNAVPKPPAAPPTQITINPPLVAPPASAPR